MLNKNEAGNINKTKFYSAVKNKTSEIDVEDKVYVVIVLTPWLLSVNYDIINPRTDNNSL